MMLHSFVNMYTHCPEMVRYSLALCHHLDVMTDNSHLLLVIKWYLQCN